MEYTCPNPQCKSSWTLGESYYRGATLFDCGACKKITTIPIYCPSCYPRSVEKKQYLDFPPENSAGESIQCGRCRKVFTIPVTHDGVYQRMKSWGVELGKYQQSGRIDTLTDRQLKNTVSGGYCAGVVYDWIRRLLLGGKTTYADAKPRQDKRVAYAWTQQTSEKKSAFLQAKSAKLDQAFTLHQDRENDSASREIAELERKIDLAFQKLNQITGITAQQRRETSAKIQASYEAGAREIYAKRDANIDQTLSKINAWGSQGTMQRFWGEFSRVMDEYLASDRLARGKTGDSQRRYCDLKIMREAPTTLYNGITDYIDKLMRDPEFTTNRAVYVSLNPPIDGAVGHAVGIFRQNTGHYYLFDPNFGVYELSTSSLRESFIYIFKKAYPNMGDGTSDNHAYEINGKVKGGYTIFEGAHPPVPSVTVVSQPLVTVQKPPIVQTRTTPVPFKPVVTSRPVPQTGQKLTGGPTTSTGTPPKTGTQPNTGTPPNTGTQPNTGGKVSGLISKFNRT